MTNEPGLVEFLRTVPLFSEVMLEDLPHLAELLEEKDHKEGAVIFREDEKGEALYIIRKGTVQVRKGAPQPLVLSTLRERDYFGEMAILDWEGRSAAVHALSEVHLLEFTRDDLHRLLAAWPQIATAMLKSLSLRLREVEARLLEAQQTARP